MIHIRSSFLKAFSDDYQMPMKNTMEAWIWNL